MAKKTVNGAAKTRRADLSKLQESNRQLALRYEQQVNRALRESLTDFLDNYVDPRGALLDDNGEMWAPIGAARKGVTAGRWTWGFGAEEELFEAQAECRQLAFANEFAINGHENRVNYIVGFGHQYSVTQKTDGAAGDDLIAETKAWLDELLRENRWPEKQQETVRRRDRDGECFIRMFHDRAGMTRWRFIEPEQVKRPSEIEATEANTFGVVTDADDAETREGYYVDGEWIAAQEIQHRRANADSNRKRGVPLFYPVRKNLRRAEKLLRNMGTVAGIQAAVAWFEKITGAAQSTVQSYVASGADASVTNQTTGKTNYFTQYPPGSIIRKPGNTELEFPSSQVNPANFVPVLQAELRAVAARLCMPEWMLTSSADMANYASTMVGEGPAVRMFERAQGQQVADDLELIRLALAHAVTAGRLPAQALTDVEIQVEPPTLAVRDVLKEVQADLLLLGQRIMSPQTVSGRNSLDYEQEQANIEQHDVAHPPVEREYLPPPQPSSSAMGDVSEAVLAYLREGRGDNNGWKTINGNHVFVEDGIISKGPKKLIGKKASNMSGDSDAGDTDGDIKKVADDFEAGKYASRNEIEKKHGKDMRIAVNKELRRRDEERRQNRPGDDPAGDDSEPADGTDDEPTDEDIRRERRGKVTEVLWNSESHLKDSGLHMAGASAKSRSTYWQMAHDSGDEMAPRLRLSDHEPAYRESDTAVQVIVADELPESADEILSPDDEMDDVKKKLDSAIEKLRRASEKYKRDGGDDA